MPTPPSTKGKRVSKPNAHATALLIEFMLHGMYTVSELAYMSGLHYVTVLNYTHALHKVGACFIDHWEKDRYGRDALKVYRIGKGTDAKRTRLTDAQRQANYRAKQRGIAVVNLFVGD